MEDEELPSESTSAPIFRRNINKTISSTNSHIKNSSSSNVLNKKSKSTSTKTKRLNLQAKKQSGSRKNKTYIQSKTKSKTTTTLLDDYGSTDDDMDVDNNSTPVQKSHSNNSSTHQINIHTEENSADLNDSLQSNETVDDEPNPQSKVVSKKTTKTKEDVWKYFKEQPNGKMKCTLCTNPPKLFPKSSRSSDSNLRSHLGRTHKLKGFLYPSQRPTTISLPTATPISGAQKKILDAAAIQAIIEDSHSFNLFRKSGMQKFLKSALTGYKGPSRRTVVKRLLPMYKERRSTIRDNLSSVSDVSLSADMWQSIRRDHFLCLAVHYYDKHFQVNSHVIAFRRFHGAHDSNRIEEFITHELEKLNIQTKICSITSDNGSDIRAATQNKVKFGTRISCLLHVFNLVAQNGMWLFKVPTVQSKTSSTTTTNSSNAKSNRTSFKPSAIKSKSIPSAPRATKSKSIPSTPRATKSKSIISTSNTTRSDETILGFTDSSTEDDDYDSMIDDNEDSDGVSDDNASESTDEGSDVSNSSDNISTTTAKSSLSDNASNGSRTQNNAYYKNLNAPLSSTITEEEFLNQASIKPSILLFKVHTLLKRIRQLLKMIRNTSGLHRYVVKQIKLKLENINRQREAEKKEKIKYKEFALDMKIRWNSSFVMLSRFVFYSSIIMSLTQNPPEEINLKSYQYTKLKKLSFTSLDWSILKALEIVLAPFNDSTKILSRRRRPTLSIGQSQIRVLKEFLAVADDAPLTLVNLLKEQLLLNLNFYLNKHVSDDQFKAMLVSSFLDPSTYPYLTENDVKEAEIIIINEAQQHYITINPQSSSSLSQSPTTTPSNIDEQNSQEKMLKNFFMTYGIERERPTKSSISKPASIKEEIAQYVATRNLYPTFSQYWSTNKDRLPILSSFVRKYNIMCATSIDCESAFSVAAYLHRKSRSALAPSTLRYSMILREQVKNDQT